MQQKRLNVGLIGTGMIGKLHAENLAYRIPDANLVWVADVNAQAVRDVAERLRVPHATSDYHEILADPAVDAVVICSSTHTHAPITCEAAVKSHLQLHAVFLHDGQRLVDSF